jgi:hypothetical protein
VPDTALKWKSWDDTGNDAVGTIVSGDGFYVSSAEESAPRPQGDDGFFFHPEATAHDHLHHPGDLLSGFSG